MWLVLVVRGLHAVDKSIQSARCDCRTGARDHITTEGAAHCHTIRHTRSVVGDHGKKCGRVGRRRGKRDGPTDQRSETRAADVGCQASAEGGMGRVPTANTGTITGSSRLVFWPVEKGR